MYIFTGFSIIFFPEIFKSCPIYIVHTHNGLTIDPLKVNKKLGEGLRTLYLNELVLDVEVELVDDGALAELHQDGQPTP